MISNDSLESSNSSDVAYFLQRDNGQLRAPLLAEEDHESFQEQPISNGRDCDAQPRTWASLLGRGTLLMCACLFASLNVCFRYLYSCHGPPSVSTINFARGWMTFVPFLPLLMWSKQKSSSQRNNTTGQSSQTIGRDNSSLSAEATIVPNDDDMASNSQPTDPEHAISNSPQELSLSPGQEETNTGLTSSSSCTKSLRIVALELSFWNFLAQALNAWGLLSTPSARASFLGQTTVVMVPLLAAGFLGQPLRHMVLWGCFTSFCGLLCLSYEDLSDPQALSTMGFGDGLILLATLCWSIYIIRISQKASDFDSVSLQATKNFILAIMYSLWFFVAAVFAIEEGRSNLWSGWRNPVAWAVLAYSAVGPGTAADLLQQYGQEQVPATEANLILSMEPVFTTIMGRVLLGETTSVLDKVGGFCLILGAVVASI